MNALYNTVLIISDIEGSSGCWDHQGAQDRTPQWARACADMSRDVNAVVAALFEAGVTDIYVKDFHRSGYNLLPELIDRRARIIHGYRAGPIPGIGASHGAGAVFMIGMHAPSGSGGFLAHTLTSRIARLEMNGEVLSEAELFAASLAPYLVRPVFISGCPVTCRQAEMKIPGIRSWPIDKSRGPDSFNASSWRSGLSCAAVEALTDDPPVPYRPAGPFRALVTMRDGEEEAVRLSKRWGYEQREDTIEIFSPDMDSLYRALIRLCYLTPIVERMLRPALALFNIMGRMRQGWVRNTLRRPGAV